MPMSAKPVPVSRVATILLSLAVAATAIGCSATKTASQSSTTRSSSAGTIVIPQKNGPGVTDTTVTISYGAWLNNGGVSASVERQYVNAIQAIVSYANTRGGLGGRKVKLLPIASDPGRSLEEQRGKTYGQSNGLPVPDPTNGKQTCDAYATMPVFALLGSDLVSTPLGTAASGACLNSAGHPVIGVRGWSTADFQAAPATAGLALATDRSIDALVAGGKSVNFFGSGGKYAVLTDATDPTTSSTAALASLEKIGVQNPQVLAVNPALSQAEALNLAVKMKSSGIDHVVVLLDQTVTPQFFDTLTPVLQKQRYVPKMLMLDIDASTAAYGLTTEQAANFFVFKSSPDIETAGISDSAYANAPGVVLCHGAAQANPTLAKSILPLESFCSELQLLKDALAGSGSQFINAQAFTTGLNKLNNYSSVDLISTSFTSTRHDGATGIVQNTYSAQCQCDKYSSKIITF